MRIGRIVLAICLAAGLLGAFAMRGVVARPATTPASPPTANEKAAVDRSNARAVDSATVQLQTGDIVLRMGIGADSYLLAQLNRKNKNYSHCGIVVIERGKPFVYHSIGGEDNPDERLRREAAPTFFSPDHNSAIAVVRYNMKPGEKKRLAEVAGTYYRRRPKFDLKFDLATDDKLYCSEFVYKAVREATGDTAYIGTTKGLAGRYIAIDNLLLNKHAQTVLEIKFKQYLYHRN